MPKSAQPWVLTLLRTIFDQPDAAQVHAQFDRVVDALAEKFPAAAEHLDAARSDLLAFTVFPRELWRHTAAEQITGLFPRQAPHPAPPTRGSRWWTAL